MLLDAGRVGLVHCACFCIVSVDYANPYVVYVNDIINFCVCVIAGHIAVLQWLHAHGVDVARVNDQGQFWVVSVYCVGPYAMSVNRMNSTLSVHCRTQKHCTFCVRVCGVCMLCQSGEVFRLLCWSLCDVCQLYESILCVHHTTG